MEKRSAPHDFNSGGLKFGTFLKYTQNKVLTLDYTAFFLQINKHCSIISVSGKYHVHLDELLTLQSIFYFISFSHGVVIFSAFSNIYSGGLFLLTNKNLESAETCGFQTKFRQIALSDALLTFLVIVAPSVATVLTGNIRK